MTAFLTPDRTASPAADAQHNRDLAFAMQSAIEHHRQQQFDTAAALYRSVLQIAGDHADAHYHLGVLFMQTGRPAEAVPHFEAALGQVPKNGQIWVYYINALVASQQTEAARMALDLARQQGLPQDAVDTLLGRIAQASGALESAPEPASAPTQDDAPALEEPGATSTTMVDTRRASVKELRQFQNLFDSEKFDAALKVARRLTENYPSHGECWFELGRVLQRTGGFAESMVAGEQAARLLPNHIAAQIVQADRLVVLRQFQRAEVHCREALEKFPESAPLHRDLGTALMETGRFAEGLVHLRRAVELAPNSSVEFDALAGAYGKHGLYDEAEAALRRALELGPMQAATHSNLLFYLMHKPDLDAASAFAEFREFAARHEASPSARRHRHTNDRDPSRRLRIGFVSGDLVNHPVASFFLSVLEHLASDTSLSLHIYSNYSVTDSFTERVRAHAQTWSETFGMTNEAVVQKIRDDKIDILVDLSGHTGRNRLVAFAQKAAPVQASWIGNPSTTGLDAVDYYLSDRFVTPLAQFEHLFSEKLVFLPALAPFKPYAQAPDVNELPALKNGYITFGSFSRIVKIGPKVVALWARVLREVPNSRMLIGAITAPEQMIKLTEQFVSEGIDVSRVSFLKRGGVTTYLQQHNLIDVCLDTFPFGNSTTTMQALWMGVPTMTLPGGSMASRSSTGWLSHLGIEAPFVAEDKDDFVRKCAVLAADPEALAVVRRELREYCRKSVLIDAAAISHAASRAFRTMWQRWCKGLKPEHFEVLVQEEDGVAVTPAAHPPAVEPKQPDAASRGAIAPAPIRAVGTQAVSAAVKPIRFVCGTRCSGQQFADKTALGRSLKLYEHKANIQLQLFDNNAHGLSSIYNAAIDAAKKSPAILVFVHDDVWLTDVFWDERIRESLGHFDVVGLAGNVRRVPRQPAWCFTPDMRPEERKFLSGTVAHGKGFPGENVLNFGPSGLECKLLDGLLMIADSDTLVNSKLRFDEQFKFHFYDMDFCRQAELKGLRMGTWPLSVVHESKGGCDSADWRQSYDLYLRKYEGREAALMHGAASATPFFSIIIPTHQRPKLLRRALQSVKSQAMPVPFEILVVADTSDDETDVVCEEMLGEADRYMRRIGKAGPSESRNLALDQAKGRYVLFLDDDDALHPGALAELYAHPSVQRGEPVYFNCSVVEERRSPAHTETLSEKTVDQRGRLTDDSFTKNQLPLSCYAFPRALMDGIRFDPFMRAYEDWEFLLAVFERQMPTHVPVLGPRVHLVSEGPSDRRGSAAVAKDFNAVLDYLYVYRRRPAPTESLKAKRSEFLQRMINLSVPAATL
ncbi:tetratricopeptide repeat protein [Paraburkholderia sp. J94]|uniref:O-linked N-acetylglucosamine transferase family protein n=1 Tax=Paraburkholderia sp. J94 TaxID=2805441 RepID=UPI002AB23B7D|nr:tetratricopeptide repeat protein [Paraburkholderia sp. J94]